MMGTICSGSKSLVSFRVSFYIRVAWIVRDFIYGIKDFYYSVLSPKADIKMGPRSSASLHLLFSASSSGKYGFTILLNWTLLE